VLEDPYVLIANQKVGAVKDILPVLEQVIQAGRPLLIVAEVTGQASGAICWATAADIAPLRLAAQVGGILNLAAGVAGMLAPAVTGFLLAVGLPDGVVGEARGPESKHWFCAAGESENQVEDELAFAPGVRGVYDLADVLSGHQPRHHLVLILGLFDGGVAEFWRKNGHGIEPPGLQLGVVAFGPQRLHQMPHAPGDDGVVSLDETSPGLRNAQRGRDGAAHAGLFGDDETDHGVSWCF